MQIMISHDHREKNLATALRTLLETIGLGEVKIWYSSDERPGGGMDTGEWWTTLKQRIEESHYVFAVLTPSSQNRPWIQWECGGASTQENTRDVVPVIFNMRMNDLEGPLAGFQAYQGDSTESLIQLINRTLRFADVHIDATNMDDVRPHFDYYLDQVNDFFAEDIRQKLFDRSFHKPDDNLAGVWYATWYDKDENVFVRDEVEIFMTDERVQGVAKTGKQGFASELPYYPMEGRISADRILTLNYWDVYGFTICGNLILRVGGSGRKMIGRWQGWTTNEVDGVDMWMADGKVVWSRQPHEQPDATGE